MGWTLAAKATALLGSLLFAAAGANAQGADKLQVNLDSTGQCMDSGLRWLGWRGITDR
jgi:hypothetical protein